MMITFLFWLFLCFILYTYVGYTLILMTFVFFKRLYAKQIRDSRNYEPDVTLIIPSYNEELFIENKVLNCMQLNYPSEKLHILWITDGTTDNSTRMLEKYPAIKVMHDPVRRGKIHAMNRAMKEVKTPVVVFTDANSMLNRDAIREIVLPFAEEKTGCVAGEKRIADAALQVAVDAGEGLYWKYESYIKKLESETGSVVGAAGELFAVRTALYENVREDTLLDDFALSLQMIRKGYKIKYAPGAWGTETASITVKEEIKRKIRIASGGMQSLIRMTDLLNPFRYGLFSFKFVSHKVFRWTVVPFSFVLILLLNLLIVITPDTGTFYILMLGMQCLFYVLAFAGRIFENIRTRIGIIFAPYYLFMMNYAVMIGFFRFFAGNYSVKWQKVKRT